jgi:hypothetical protein
MAAGAVLWLQDHSRGRQYVSRLMLPDLLVILSPPPRTPLHICGGRMIRVTIVLWLCDATGDVFGDFEDVEANLTFSGADAVTAAAQQAIADASVRWTGGGGRSRQTGRQCWCYICHNEPLGA